MKRIIHKTAYHIVGWLCILIGLLGLIAPILPGIILIIIGLYFLSLASLRFYTKIHAAKNRFPKLARYYDKFDQKVSTIFKKAH